MNKNYSFLIAKMKINNVFVIYIIYNMEIANSTLCTENEEFADVNHLIFSCSKKIIDYKQLPVNIQALLAFEIENIHDI